MTRRHSRRDEDQASSRRHRTDAARAKDAAEDHKASGRRRGSSRARAAAGTEESKDGKPTTRASRRAALSDEEREQLVAERRGRQHKSSWRSNLPLILILILLGLGDGFGCYFPTLRRNMKLNELDEAPADQAFAVADQFLALVENSRVHVRNAIVRKRGSVEVRIYLAQKVKGVEELIIIAGDPGLLDDDRRAIAVKAAADLWLSVPDRERDSADNLLLVQDLEEWVKQSTRKKKHRDLAAAAMKLVAVRGRKLAGEDPSTLLYRVASAGDEDPLLVTAAAEALAKVLSSANLGLGLKLLSSANSERVLECLPLLRAIEGAVRAEHLAAVLDLLSRDNEALQKFAMGLMGLVGSRGALTKEAQENVGKQVTAYLNDDIRTTKPAMFKETLKAVRSLKLTGAWPTLVGLLGAFPIDAEEAGIISGSLADFVNGAKDDKTLGNAVLEGLVKALGDGKLRANAAKAVQFVSVAGYTALRDALDACIRAGADEACFAAAKHIVEQLYQRKDVSNALGNDLKAWEEHLKKDRPAFDRFKGYQKWYEENQQFQRHSDGSQVLSRNRQECLKIRGELAVWLEKSAERPLGLEKGDVELLDRALGLYQSAVMRSSGGLDPTERLERPEKDQPPRPKGKEMGGAL